ncbi:DUF4097 domain-containing protein [Cohnella pontilimi]|uniref:DUF4097 domain-containing protein n=1 Tax=Cohnella pontilimi TaxID=2564100 RepID=A0A4U0FAM2_9BACL|nr:DUF4097 family beta strand repeat-containing protein [Cohnella pontilimi]TJY41846.1 DUF4097 domain-containing protein [Cohnella pontilimi]
MAKLRTVAGIALVIIGLAVLAGNRWSTEEPMSNLDKKWTFASGELRNLQTKSDYETEIRFVKSSDGTNSVSITGQGTKQMRQAVSEAALSSGTLELDLRNQSWRWFDWLRFGSTDAKQQIVVALADGSPFLETLQVKSDSGSLAVYGAQVRKADLQIDSGSVTIRDLTADRLNIRADSGSITANGVHGNAEIHADSGSIKLENVTGPTRLSADSGSIKLYKEDTSSTDIKAESGSVYVHMPASFAGVYDVQADSGTVHAPESKRQTGDVVKVRADSGSIRVEQD